MIRKSATSKKGKAKKTSSKKTTRKSGKTNMFKLKAKLNQLRIHWNEDGKAIRLNKGEEVPSDMTSPVTQKTSTKIHPALWAILGVLATAGITIGILLSNDPKFFDGIPILDDIGNKIEFEQWVDRTSERVGYDVSPPEFKGLDINADYTSYIDANLSDAQMTEVLQQANKDLSALVSTSHYVALSSSQVEQMQSLKSQIAELENYLS